MAESLLLASLVVGGSYADRVVAMTSSHFASSERQYRFPLGYGGQRTPTAQWTVTGAGAALVCRDGSGPRITGCTIGAGALVEDSVVMPGVVIESGAIVRHAILGENSRICKNAVVGGAFAEGEQKKISVTSKGAVVETVLLPGDMV